MDCDTVRVLKEVFMLLEIGIRSMSELRTCDRGANVLPEY